MRERDPVAKAFALLREVVESRERTVSVRRLASALGMPVSTVHRIIASLTDIGILERDSQTSQYEPGVELLRLARLLTHAYPAPEVALPYLEELTHETGETSLLCTYDRTRHKLMFVCQVEGAHPLRYVVPLHTWVEPHLGASGLAVLAYLEEEALEAVLKHIEEFDPARAHLADEQIRQVRGKGYARSHGQRIAGAIGIAAPVFGPGQIVFGDVIVTIPEVRFDPADEADVAQRVRRCARQVTSALGGDPQD